MGPLMWLFWDSKCPSTPHVPTNMSTSHGDPGHTNDKRSRTGIRQVPTCTAMKTGHAWGKSHSELGKCRTKHFWFYCFSCLDSSFFQDAHQPEPISDSIALPRQPNKSPAPPETSTSCSRAREALPHEAPPKPWSPGLDSIHGNARAGRTAPQKAGSGDVKSIWWCGSTAIQSSWLKMEAPLLDQRVGWSHCRIGLLPAFLYSISIILCIYICIFPFQNWFKKWLSRTKGPYKSFNLKSDK